jgi:hypothetical protein
MSAALYLAADPLEARILRDYLAGQGIAVRIDGEHLWSARGELPIEYPRLYLLDPADAAHARKLLTEYECRAHNGSTWVCGCGESVPAHFELCWNCGGARPEANP